METNKFISRSNLDAPTLNAWIEAKWLAAITDQEAFLFSEADLAQTRFVQDRSRDVINDEGITIALQLLDQLQRLLCLLRDIEAIETCDRPSGAQ